MTDKIRLNVLKSYYMDTEEELMARQASPKTSQNKKRIDQCEQELNNLCKLMGILR